MIRNRSVIGGVILIVAAASASPAWAKDELDVSRIQKILAAKGQHFRDERVLKFTIPRTDVKVTMQGVPLDPFLGVASTIGFQELHSGRIMLMADLALFEDEVNPVIDICLGSGLAVTGLHTQFASEDPKVYVLHVDGGGKGEELAQSIRTVLDRTRDIRQSNPRLMGVPVGDLSDAGVSARALEKAVGQDGQTKDGMVKFVLGRGGVRLACGCAVSKEMQVKNWAVFAGRDDDALVNGEIAAFDGELQTTLKSLRKANINITGMHTHLEGETPRVVFVSFWGRGPADDLARIFRSILDQQKQRAG